MDAPCETPKIVYGFRLAAEEINLAAQGAKVRLKSDLIQEKIPEKIIFIFSKNFKSKKFRIGESNPGRLGESEKS